MLVDVKRVFAETEKKILFDCRFSSSFSSHGFRRARLLLRPRPPWPLIGQGSWKKHKICEKDSIANCINPHSMYCDGGEEFPFCCCPPPPFTPLTPFLPRDPLPTMVPE